MKPLVSIIIPISNNSNLIYPSLKTITNQSYKNLEIIFIDDESYDTSLKILKKCQLSEPRLKILSSESFGRSFAQNLGIKQATGKYIMFFKIGNLISENLIEYLIQIAEENNNSQITLCDYFNISESQFINSSYEIPSQKKENIKKTNSKQYLKDFSSSNTNTFEKASALFNKLFNYEYIKNFLFDTTKYHSDEFAIFNLMLKEATIISSNQKLIANTQTDEYFKNTYFSYVDLEEIEFLQNILLHFKKNKDTEGVKNIAIRLLDLLCQIRKKLSFWKLDIYDKDEQIKSIDKKFSSIYRFLKSHFPEEQAHLEYSKKYKKILHDEFFRKKYYYLYPIPPEPSFFQTED